MGAGGFGFAHFCLLTRNRIGYKLYPSSDTRRPPTNTGLTVKQAAKNIWDDDSPTAVRRLLYEIKRGNLKAFKLPGATTPYLISPKDLQAYKKYIEKRRQRNKTG
jgi:hypothetical protein